MEKVGFFRSIHLKFVIIYVLLILVAMQIIGVYFVRQLESTLQENFKDAIQERVNLLSYYVEEQMTKVRLPDEEAPSQEEDIRRLLSDYNSADISEVRVVDESLKILGTSDPDNQGVVGGRSTDNLIKMAIATQIGELATDAIFGLFEDMLADLISDWLLNNSPDFIQDLFVVGQDLVQIVHHVTLTSDLHISKLQNDYYIEGTQFFLGITLYWKLGCAEEGEPDYDPECGALPLTLEDLEDTDIPVNLIEGKFTATVDNWNHLTVSKHEIQLNYGALILFVINDLLLPAV